MVCIARQTNQDRGFVSIKVSTTRTQNLLQRIAVGSICHIFVVDSPEARKCQRHYFAIGQLYFFGSQSGVQCLTVGRLQHSLGEGPEQGSAGTKWGSRTSSPSREAFSGALPPFVTDGDGWLGRPRGTLADVRRSQEVGRSHSAVAPVQQLPWPPELASPARSTP